MGYSPWDRKELDTTENTHTHTTKPREHPVSRSGVHRTRPEQLVERPSQALNLHAGLASVRMKAELVFNDGEAGVRMQRDFRSKITPVPQLSYPCPHPTSYCRFSEWSLFLRLLRLCQACSCVHAVPLPKNVVKRPSPFQPHASSAKSPLSTTRVPASHPTHTHTHTHTHTPRFYQTLPNPDTPF